MRHKFISACLILWILFMMPITAFAQSFDADRLGSVSVTLMEQYEKTPIADAELTLYYVATVTLNSNNNLNYIFADTFKNCGTTLDDPNLAVKLDAFVENNIVPYAKLVTDGSGNVSFENESLKLDNFLISSLNP